MKKILLTLAFLSHFAIAAPIYLPFDNVLVFEKGLAVAIKGDKKGLINTQGEIVFPLGNYTQLDVFSESFWGFKNGKKKSIFINGFGEAVDNYTLSPQRGSEPKHLKVTINGHWKTYNLQGQLLQSSKNLGILSEKDLYSSEKDGDFFIVEDKKTLKKGFMDQSGKLLIPIEYDDITPLNHRVVVRKNSLAGLMDLSGKRLTEMKYTSIRTNDFSDTLFSFFSSTGNGLIDYNGKEIIRGKYRFETNKYKRINFALLRQDGYIGLVDADGDIKPLDYDEVEPLSFNAYFLRVKKNNKYGLISWNGEEFIPAKYDSLDNNAPFKTTVIGGSYFPKLAGTPYLFICPSRTTTFFGKRKNISTIKHKRLIDQKGNIVSNLAEYDRVQLLTKYVVAVHKTSLFAKIFGGEGGWGLIDNQGKELYPNDYDEFIRLSDKLVGIRDGKKWGLIDEKGKLKVLPKYEKLLKIVSYSYPKKNKDCCDDESIKIYHEFIRVEKNGYFGLRDAWGNTVLPTNYLDIQIIGTDRFFVQKNGTRLIVDSKNKTLIEFAYDDFSFDGEISQFIAVFKGEKIGMLDGNTKEIIPPIYDKIWPNTYGRIKAIKDGKWLFFNEKGQVVFAQK